MNRHRFEPERKNFRAGAFSILLLMAMVIMTFASLAPVAQAQAPTPHYHVGYVFEDDGTTPVENATVNGICGLITDSTTTNETGYYILDFTGATNDTTVFVMAQNGTEFGSTSFTSDITGQETPHNITLGAYADYFLVTIFAYDGDTGIGVADVWVNITLAGVDVQSVQTNETGYATTFLLADVFDFTADTDNTSYRDQIGDFEVIDGEGATVLIDMVGETLRSLNLLGFELTDTCLFMFVVGIGVVLALLLVGHGRMNGKGALSSTQIILVAVVVVLAVLLFMANSADFDFSISGILNWLGLEVGSLGVNTEAVGMYLLLMTAAMAILGVFMGIVSYSGGVNQVKTLWFSILMVGLQALAFLLVPGYPTAAYYGVIVAIVALIVLIVFHVSKGSSPTGESAAVATLVLWAAVGVIAMLAILNTINGGELFV